MGLDVNIMLHTTPKQSIQLAAGKILPKTIFVLKGLHQSFNKSGVLTLHKIVFILYP